MLIGMLVWIDMLDRADVAHATTYISRFTASPRKGRLEQALCVFGYLKTRPNRRFKIDSSTPIITGETDKMDKDFVKESMGKYPETSEKIDVNIHEPLFDKIPITTFVDSDYSHDKLTKISMNRIYIFISRTPI